MNTGASMYTRAGEARTLADQEAVPDWFGALFNAQFRSMQSLATFILSTVG
ncbi:MAG: hypothetical protein ACR2P2_22305 [Nakamurella sp.]